MLPVVLTSLLACGPATIQSKAGAPFNIKGVSNALFAFEDGSDARYGSAVGLLTTEPTDCKQLLEMRYTWDLAELLTKGDGLFFVLDYSNYEAERGGSPPSWEGLWMSGYSVSVDADEYRTSAVGLFHDGYLYAGGYYGGSSGFVDIREADDSTVSGRFDHMYWKGTFKAENCGGFGESGDAADTAWWGSSTWSY